MLSLPIDPLILIIVLIFSFLIFVVIALVFGNVFNLFKVSQFPVKSDIQAAKVHDDAVVKANKILEEAKINSLKIIEESTRKAQKIINETSDINVESKNKIDNTLNSMLVQNTKSVGDLSSTFMSLYEKALKTEQERSLELIKNVAQNAEKSLIKNVTSFENLLYKNTIKNEDDVKDLIQQEYMKAHNDIERYKMNTVRELDKRIIEIIREVSKEVFINSIEIPVQEDIVMQILNKQKDKFLI